MSKTELVGPIHAINLPSEEASHFLGFTRNSLSTLSQGIDVQEISYIRFKKRMCMLNIGINGRKALAASTENIFPKLELAVILIYLIILP